MKALSLWQPWASAIALGKKKVETRSWATQHRGLVAIHAAKRPLAQCLTISEMKLYGARLGCELVMIPRGGVVALARLVRCVATEHFEPTPAEREWGNYAECRFAWVLDEIRPLRELMPLKGKQGLWGLSQDLAERIVSLT